MKQIIKGNSMILQNPMPLENFGKYQKLFQPYFRRAAHHYQAHHSINKDAILIYSYFPNEIHCSGCNSECRSINIPVHSVSSIPSEVFFQSKFRDINCSQVTSINYGGIRVGYYCEKNNVLCTSDIAHDSTSENHIKAILIGMENAGLLHKLDHINGNQEVTLGTDPEMESLVDGKVIPGNHLPSINTLNKAYISSDGARNQRELRPDPSSDPEELVENIRDLIKISSFFGEELSVAGNIFSLGGHIHIGGASPSPELISVLDYFLLPFNAFSSAQRKASKYGKLGDYRFQPHGFEYRTPPSAWLLTPKLALMTLQLVKVLSEKIINNYDVTVSDSNDPEEYKQLILELGFSNDWVEEFVNEIQGVNENINKPLAVLWGVEVPTEYKAKKKYQPSVDSSYTQQRQVYSITNEEEEQSPDGVDVFS